MSSVGTTVLRFGLNLYYSLIIKLCTKFNFDEFMLEINKRGRTCVKMDTLNKWNNRGKKQFKAIWKWEQHNHAAEIYIYGARLSTVTIMKLELKHYVGGTWNKGNSNNGTGTI